MIDFIYMLYKAVVGYERDCLLYMCVIWGIKPEVDVTNSCDIRVFDEKFTDKVRKFSDKLFCFFVRFLFLFVGGLYKQTKHSDAFLLSV